MSYALYVYDTTNGPIQSYSIRTPEQAGMALNHLLRKPQPAGAFLYGIGKGPESEDMSVIVNKIENFIKNTLNKQGE